MKLHYLACCATLCATWAAAFAQTSDAVLAGMGNGVLRETGQARQAVAAHEKQAAIQHIEQGLILANQALDTAKQRGLGTTVAISKELDTETTYRPVHKSGRLKKNSNVREVSGSMSADTIDVAIARDRLQTARSAVDAANWSDADSALAAVQQSVTHSTVSGDMPMLRAKENLRLARARILEGKYKDAAMPLRSAAQALRELQINEAGFLSRDIDDYAKRVGGDHSDALNRIDDWMNRIDQWK